LKKKVLLPRRRARAPRDPFEATRRDSMGEWLEDALRQVPDLELRRMFGGVGIFSADTMFGILRFVRLLPGKRVPVTALRELIQAALSTPPKRRASR
jgi:hypothetical protein